ncbi:hypothetical protein DQW77_00440 [Roseovarius sp. TE539]|uniref:DUF4139 domain-containing protein n=1 Tax=Roseovarius sp. TE539 TaxID=2249812 RepID=UPI000DE12AAD|nr:DUF4139 domain-containing protein [Roseovarius sp. TE539]RBI77509.1 hypothetical protein DQW77_00440 [Roseovarius sp. TE539]
MRLLSLCLLVMPSTLLADDIALRSAVTSATVYPRGATVTREVPFSMPAGRHALVLTDLPRGTPLESVTVSVDGAVMGSVTARNDFVPPRDPETTEAIASARAKVERLEAELRTGRAEVAAIRLEEDAARARNSFLESLATANIVADMDVGALRDLSRMIGNETLAAKQQAHAAGLRADDANRALSGLEDELKRARAELAALVPGKPENAMLSVAVSSDTPAEGSAIVTYTIADASWHPVYDLDLSRETGMLDINRGAFVTQRTGENWTGIDLTLETGRPSDQTEPSEIFPRLRRIEEDRPSPSLAEPRTDTLKEAQNAAGTDAPAPLRIDAMADFDGLVASYRYPDPVSIASRADRVRLSLDTLRTRADLVATAVPRADDRAFLTARITNDTGEVILPSAQAMFHLDGRFVARRHLELLPAGGEAELSFGPIDGLRLDRVILDRTEGDRGVLTTSNTLTEGVRLNIENLTGADWPLRVLDRVPYTEQEDLELSWNADPAPSETDIDGKRGVMAWEFDLPAGESRDILLEYELDWPEGMVLR